MIKVAFYENGTHFASFDMPELPRVGDTVEIGFPNQSVVKSFTVRRVVHKMVQIPPYTTRYVEGVPVQCENDPPWRWEHRLYGSLSEPEIGVYV